ncbi:dihydrofolate reductase family protein [Microseira sp. BLCC-F43]|jgi:dihydrofolate reductase|uniref:dihydrofolate reductase family protein n=1 Tax=Microseira sp. BLCC-F43 TaxID=3153602 RepID=UPI0035B6E8F4
MNTSKIKVFIGTTLDGYIAIKNDSLDWLFELPNPKGIDHGYTQFLSGIDTVIIGRKTYEEDLVYASRNLGGKWAESNCRIYILTTNENYTPQTDNTEVLLQLDKKTIDKIRTESQKDIYVVGGGQIISELLNLGAIDEMILCIFPIVIGSGIKLFPNDPKETKFDLVKAEHFETGAVNLTYKISDW